MCSDSEMMVNCVRSGFLFMWDCFGQTDVRPQGVPASPCWAVDLFLTS
jgi:hypothetical protein